MQKFVRRYLVRALEKLATRTREFRTPNVAKLVVRIRYLSR